MFKINSFNGDYFHIYNRGIDGKNLFIDEEDYRRFLESMRVYNSNLDTCEPISFSKRCLREYPIDNQLVYIYQFALLPNHFHLLVKEKVEGGIPLFFQRLKISYSKYANKKHKRRGYFFESAYHCRFINSDPYLEHLTRYIHLNPLNVFGIDWKNNEIRDKTNALTTLISYKWSSFYYYFHQLNETFLDLSLLNQLFSSVDDHVKYLFEYKTSNVHFS